MKRKITGKCFFGESNDSWTLNILGHIVRDEIRQSTKVHGLFSSSHEAIAILREEYLEMEHEVFHGTIEAAREEALQVAAMAMRFIGEFGGIGPSSQLCRNYKGFKPSPKTEGRLYYLASPYTHSNPEIQRARYDAALDAVVKLKALGYTVFSPIVHSCPVAHVTSEYNLDHWLEIDKIFVRKCDEMIVLNIDGMRESDGVRRELAFARNLGKPVSIYDPLNGSIDPFHDHNTPALQYGGGE